MRSQTAHEPLNKLGSEVVTNYRPSTELCKQDPARYPTTMDASIHVPNPVMTKKSYIAVNVDLLFAALELDSRVHCLPYGHQKYRPKFGRRV